MYEGDMEGDNYDLEGDRQQGRDRDTLILILFGQDHQDQMMKVVIYLIFYC